MPSEIKNTIDENFSENEKTKIKEDTKNYLEFSTETEFKNFLNEKVFLKFKNQIEELKNENNQLKMKDAEIAELTDQVNIFKKHILEKYDVNDFQIQNDKTDFTSFENFEKSILLQFENSKINYKKSDDKNQTDEIPKIYM